MADAIVTLIWPIEDGAEERTDVFGSVESVGRSEFFAGAQTGLKPQYKVTLWESDYDEQPIAVVRGKRMSVYRTYVRDDQKIELYLAEKIGVR